MNARQQTATALIAFLMLATILAMPPRFANSAHPVAAMTRQAGTISVAPVASAELPQEQVRDFTYR